MAVASIALTFTSECFFCKNPLPVNQLSDKILCASCSNEMPATEEFWVFFISKKIGEASKMKPGTSTSATGSTASLGKYSLNYGNIQPKCKGCDAEISMESLFDLASNGETRFSCSECGTISSVRVPPAWFKKIAPFAVLLVGESAPDAEGTFTGSTEGISIKCYQCGGPLPIDGSSRSVKCIHCSADLLVPDDIWQRLHPAVTVHQWYIIINTDKAAELLPGEIDDFLDLAALPGGDTALLWKEDSEISIGRADRKGALSWINRKINAGDHSRLLYSIKDRLLWILDCEDDNVLAFNAETGALTVTINNKKDDPGLISAIDHEGIAVMSDGSLIVYRCWEDDKNTFRRFDSSGKRIPLWPGKNDEELPGKFIEWDDLPDNPGRPPDGAWICGGPNGKLYLIERETGRFAYFDSDGKFEGIVKPDCIDVEKIQDCEISGDGSIYILFDHKKTINDTNFSHVGRIKPDGSYQTLAGPLALKNNYSLGTDMERMSVAENGDIHLCDYDFSNFRILDKGGKFVWRSLFTETEDETRAEELSEALGL